MKRNFMRVFGWVLGLSLFGWLIHRIGPTELWNAMLRMGPYTILWLAGFNILGNAFQGVRFWCLWPGGNVPVYKLMGLPFLMHTGNILLPLRVGEAVQPLTLKRWSPQHSFKSIVFWVILDKGIEIVSFTLFTLIAAFIFGKYEGWAILAFVVSHIVLVSFLRKSQAGLTRSLGAYAISLCVWICNALFFVALLEPLKMALTLFMGTSLVSSIPLAPAGLGTYEGTFVWISQKAGVPEAEAMARAISAHAISILSTLAVGLPLGALWGWPKTKGEDAQALPTASPGIPTRYIISNIVIYLMASVIILCAGALWIPDAVMPKSYRRRRAASGGPST